MLCLGGRIAEYSQSVQSGKNNIEWKTQSPTYRELDSMDGERVVVEWMIYPRAHFAEAPLGSPKHDGEWRKITFGQKSSRTESSSCRCTTTSHGARKAMKKCVKKSISSDVDKSARQFPTGIGHSSDLDLKKNGMPRSLTNQTVFGTKSPTKC